MTLKSILVALLMLVQITNPSTPSGSISIGWGLVIAVGFIGGLLSVLTVILNSTIGGIKTEISLLRKDFHEFVKQQSELNGKFEERTKHLKK